MNQRDMVLRHLRRHHSITPLQALDKYGVYRLAARIEQLRGLGHSILTDTIRTTDGKRYAKYRMVG